MLRRRKPRKNRKVTLPLHFPHVFAHLRRKFSIFLQKLFHIAQNFSPILSRQDPLVTMAVRNKIHFLFGNRARTTSRSVEPLLKEQSSCCTWRQLHQYDLQSHGPGHSGAFAGNFLSFDGWKSRGYRGFWRSGVITINSTKKGCLGVRGILQV